MKCKNIFKPETGAAQKKKARRKNFMLEKKSVNKQQNFRKTVFSRFLDIKQTAEDETKLNIVQADPNNFEGVLKKVMTIQEQSEEIKFEIFKFRTFLDNRSYESL